MSTAFNPIDVSRGDGENTRIHYVMHVETRKVEDGEVKVGLRKLIEGDIVLAGRVDDDDIAMIIDFLGSNDGFNPNAAGIPDLAERMPLSWVPTGDERHDISKISFTNSKPTSGAASAAQFAVSFEAREYRPAMTM
jgi:hypothetical protein